MCETLGRVSAFVIYTPATQEATMPGEVNETVDEATEAVTEPTDGGIDVASVPAVVPADTIVSEYTEPVGSNLAIPSMDAFQGMLAIGEQLQSTGFLPEAIKTPAQAVAIILTGKELGIPMMRALRQIRVIKGQPSMSAELMLGMFLASGGRVQWLQNDDQGARATYTRADGTQYTQEFMEKDAIDAGLIRDNLKSDSAWMRYRPAMFKARNVSAAGRAFFPDIIGGLYTPEEVASIKDVEYQEISSSRGNPENIPFRTAKELMSEKQGELIHRLAASHVWDVHQGLPDGTVHTLSDRERIFKWLESERTAEEAGERIDQMIAEIETRKLAEQKSVIEKQHQAEMDAFRPITSQEQDAEGEASTRSSRDTETKGSAHSDQTTETGDGREPGELTDEEALGEDAELANE